MQEVSELFWNASLEEIKRGYIYEEASEQYICLICGRRFTRGVIYPHENALYDAERFARLHITHEHTSMFDFLIGLDKKLTGLTEHQKTIVRYFYEGLSDNEIVKELDGGSTSTIRNHRFTLREKAKQAKILLAITELVEEKTAKPNKFISIPRSAAMVDERFAITEEENKAILQRYFTQGENGPLSEFPKKEKRKVAILKHIAKRFELNRHYTEKEVNEILKQIYPDYVTIRRYLIEYGFMDRYPDCSAYWVKF
ncbi:DUF2087 domain-containing protein [Aneurinibacillus sp. UBA3580]|jgi:hypothetical protein|uniref:DUF2087 domain-containing protein n=1 Tax=Aneurinibacillus sp. UBA3580 TaxID=1946041 RepID=UPI00257B6679|nr:DUF2087 domain-containing protein [Aneurinibacillus sp. UBA3580]